jgi:hypothetical protein
MFARGAHASDVHTLKLLGKAFGSGTELVATNVDLCGTGAPLRVEHIEGGLVAAAARVEQLVPNESYNFAAVLPDQDEGQATLFGATQTTQKRK